MNKVFNFLGSIYVAVALIVVTALIVIVGTFIESITQSHRFAHETIYTHPLFLALLFFFFINILFSALRRWPFRLRHIPFLITHLGLLIIISGIFIKSLWGIQGTISLIEGTGKHFVFLDQSYALLIEDRRGQQVISLDRLHLAPFPIDILQLYPHSEEVFQPWIQGQYGIVSEFDPVALKDWKTDPSIPEWEDDTRWNIFAVRSDDVMDFVKQVYLSQTQVRIFNRETKELLATLPLSVAIEYPYPLLNQIVQFSLEYSLDDPKLFAEFQPANEKIFIPLSGSQSLYNIPLREDAPGTFPIHIEISRPPLILLAEDRNGDHHLIAFGKGGQIHCENYPKDKMKAVVVYNKGYGGYAVPAKIPFTSQTTFRDPRKAHLEEKLSQVEQDQLPEPLRLFSYSCQQIQKNFAKTCADFLEDWDRSYSTLYPITRKLPPSVYELFAYLSKSIEKSPEEIAHLFSAYLLQHQIHFKTLTSFETDPVSEPLETPFSPAFLISEPKQKLEENRPLLVLQLKNETIALRYDPLGNGFKWPALQGRFLVRFQPQFLEIPYQIRLVNARQITLPNSNQPYRYESDLWITDLRTKETREASLSMNQVYETYDGYRFYLAGISPNQEIGAKRAQIIVNFDPAKYYLTYPGCLIVAIGMMLLFFGRRHG